MYIYVYVRNSFASISRVILLLLCCYYSHSVSNDAYVFELGKICLHTQYSYDCYKISTPIKFVRYVCLGNRFRKNVAIGRVRV